jgi:hypothetical protein
MLSLPLLFTVLLQSNSPSPAPGLLLILSVAGAFADWRYRQKGGKPPSKVDRILYWSAFGFIMLLFVVLGIMGGMTAGRTEGMLGDVIVPVGLMLFSVWELGRWIVRLKHPLPKAEAN